jgi:hypothetical protein
VLWTLPPGAGSKSPAMTTTPELGGKLAQSGRERPVQRFGDRTQITTEGSQRGLRQRDQFGAGTGGPPYGFGSGGQIGGGSGPLVSWAAATRRSSSILRGCIH